MSNWHQTGAVVSYHSGKFSKKKMTRTSLLFI